MIKTLRITGILAAILAGVLIKYFVVPMLSDVGGDPRVARLLDSEGIVERFKQTADTHNKAAGAKESPLVVQATAYARYLAPRPEQKRTIPQGSSTVKGPVLQPTSPKFQVYATAFFEGNPELSQALIDEPGKGRYWVRQSSMVGHLLLEQVKDGAIVVKSSKETFELEIEKNPKAGAAGGKPAISGQATSSIGSGRGLPASSYTVSRAQRTPPSRTPPGRTLQVDESDPAEKEKATEELVSRLKDLQRSYRSGAAGSGLDGEESARRIDKLIASFKSSTVSAEDAKDLTALGQKLEGEDEDPNAASAPSKTGKIERASDKLDESELE